MGSEMDSYSARDGDRCGWCPRTWAPRHFLCPLIPSCVPESTPVFPESTPVSINTFLCPWIHPCVPESTPVSLNLSPCPWIYPCVPESTPVSLNPPLCPWIYPHVPGSIPVSLNPPLRPLNPLQVRLMSKIVGPPAEHTAFTNRCFGGWLQSQIQCTECGHASASFEAFNDISLDIRCESKRNNPKSISEPIKQLNSQQRFWRA
jgi:hypothetical protein